MTRKKIVCSAILVFFLGLNRYSHANETKWVDPRTLKQHDFQRESLTPEQMADVKQLHQDLADVDPSSLEQWADDFRRDSDPDKQIAVWKYIAKVYKETIQDRDVSLSYKKDVFRLINTCSMAPREEVLSHAGLSILSDEEANAIMDQYYSKIDNPSPIIIQRK